MTGTRSTSRFMMKPHCGTAWAMARMSRKLWCLAAMMQSCVGGVPRTSTEMPRIVRAAASSRPVQTTGKTWACDGSRRIFGHQARPMHRVTSAIQM